MVLAPAVNGEGNFKKYAWAISLLWIGARPQDEDLKNGTQFASREESFKKRLDSIDQNVMKNKPDHHQDPDENWFIKLIQFSKTGLPHPDKAEAFETGVVKEIHLPDGGIVETQSGKRVYFHRARVYLDTVHLPITSSLSEQITLGLEMNVEYVDTTETKDEFFEDCPEPLVALVAYTDERPEIPNVIFEKPESPNALSYVAKIISFDPAGPTGVESGIAELLPVHPFVKATLKKHVHESPEIKLVRFNRKNMFHAGSNMANADLQYFFSAGVYAMNIFYCFIGPLDKPVENGPTHEVTMGWKSNLNYIYSTGQGGFAVPANTSESQLLYPQIYSFQSTKFFAKEALDAKTYENIIEGNHPPRSKYLDGTKEDEEETLIARITDIFPPNVNTKNNVVSRGKAVIESGKHAGQMVYFTR